MKKNALSLIITAAVIGILFGVLLLLCGNPEFRNSVIRVFFIIIGVFAIIANIPGVISGFAHINQKNGIFDLIGSALGIAIGVLLIIDLGTVFTVIAALYLIIMPIIRIILANDSRAQTKTELPKIIIGVIVGFLSFDGINAIANVIFTVAGIFVIVSSVAYCIAEIVYLKKLKEEKSDGKGSVIYADTTGDGNIDTVIKDIDGDGTPDIVVNISKEDKNE